MARGKRGELLSEFGAAIALFIICLLPPLINMAAVTFRYLAAYGLVCSLTRKASLCDRRTHALEFVAQPEKYRAFAKGLGFTMNACDISIICRNQESESITFPDRKPIPSTWLPGGQKGQCQYLLQTQTNFKIPPLVSFKPQFPVISAPIDVTCTTTAPWENLGCDPATEVFYINE
jgi:hypothetical protein